MSETFYRLQTESGLSEPYTLERLRQETSNGVLDAAAECTSDDGQTWVPVGSLAGVAEVQTAVADPTADSDSQATAANVSAASVNDPGVNDSGTTASSSADPSAASDPAEEKEQVSAEDGEESSDSSNASPDSGSTASHSRTRKLKRLVKGSGDSKFAKRRADRTQKKESGQAKATKTLVGAVLAGGRYTIKSMLGKGSMAYVFLVADSRLQTDAVVKVPKPEKFTTEDFRERFKRESQLLVRFSHPHVVKVLDVGEYEKLPYVVMQLLSGGSLADRMQNEADAKGRMTPDSLKSWVREVGRALDFCFRKGMVHRDVKPANILFDDDNNPYVADFGLSKIMYGEHAELNSSETAAGIVLGTPNYISPEVVLGQPYDGRADQYSMAITIYHALTGSPPMQGNSATMTMINQTQKSLPLLSEVRPDVVSRELALAVQKGIEKSPKDRFDSCEDFAEAVLEGLRAPISAVTTPSAAIPTTQDVPPSVKPTQPEPRSSGSQSASGTRSSGSSVSQSAKLRASGSGSAAGPSSQSGTRASSSSASSRRSAQRRVGPSTKSGAVASRRAAETQGAADPDLEWLGMSSDEALPPKAGSSKRSAKSKKPAKTPGVLVMGQEVHPALAISLAVGVFLLAGYVIYFKLTNVPEDDLVAVAPVITAPASPAPTANSDRSNNNNKGKGKGKGQGQKKPNGNSEKNQTAKSKTDAPQTAATAVTETPTPTEPKTPQVKTQEIVSAVAAKYETIPFEPSAGFTMGVSTCPVVISGNKVWDKAAKTVQRELNGTYPLHAQTALSPDGQLFAATAKATDQQDVAVTVWNTQTGEKLFTAAGDSKRFVDVMLLSSTSLMIGDRWSDELLVWDCSNGKRRKSIKVSNVRFKQGNAAISDDGKYVALVAAGQLGVLDASDGKPVAIMYPPDPKVRVKRVPLKASDRPKGSRRPDFQASEPVFAALQSLRFSPDNSELAGLSTFPKARMLSWNGMGDLNVDQAVAAQSSALQEAAFQWFAHRDAWLVAGNILDRSTGRVVLTTRRSSTAGASVHVYDDDHLAGVFASAPAALAIVPIPWDELAAGLQQMQNPETAALGTGTEVSLKVNLNPVLNDASEGVKTVRSSLRAVVSREDVKIEENRPTVFQVRIATSPADKSPIHERQTPLALRGRSLGSNRIPEGDCVVVELIVPEEQQPVWRENLGSLTELGLQKESADKTEKLTALIEELALPYYIPKDQQSLALPAVID
ncbi:MAG: protein kinase [Planctomycetaceae bacterium]